jgi:hypothetical protein
MPRLTKKAQAEAAEKAEQWAVFHALRWTDKIEPDIPAPKSGEPPVRGFLVFAYGSAVAYFSSCFAHWSVDCPEIRRKGGRAMYSTKMRAIRAARNEAEQRCALELRRFDRLIEEMEKES